MKNNAALQNAFALLSRRAYSEREIKQRLLQKNYDLEQIQAVIDYLAERGYLNDTALCSMLVRKYLQAGKYGSKAIINKINQRGIEPGIVQRTLEEYEFNELLQAEQIVAKQLSNTKKTVNYAKMGRFLANRGFSFSTISQVLDQFGVDKINNRP